jgi:hypothetical protein
VRSTSGGAVNVPVTRAWRGANERRWLDGRTRYTQLRRLPARGVVKPVPLICSA